jgi:copper oxidase (laccase) domain-containing protein
LTISQTNHEVGAVFRQKLSPPWPRTPLFFFGAPDYYSTCLASSFAARKAGVTARSVGLCTYADETRFFSYRRTTHRGEADYGRLLSAIVLEG